MIFGPFVAIPAEDEDREGPPKSRYISRKDIKWLVLGLIVLIFFTYPIYSNMLDDRDTHLCASNMNAIYKALSNYEAEFDDRFPPVAEEQDASTGTPLIENGRAVTWVSLAQQYDNKKDIFTCPAATDAEAVANEGTSEEQNGRTHVITVKSTYGMYRGYGAAMRSAIDRPGQVVLFTETSNRGSETAFDPLPFLDANKQPVPYDGFVVGWDNNNVAPDSSSKMLTRLAFRNSSTGNVSKAYSRHRGGLHAITADGNLILLHPGDAFVERQGGELAGHWAVPAFVKPR